MANTITKIASQTVTTAGSQVTFLSIPQTYTDLLIKLSVRDNSSATAAGITFGFNADVSTNYSNTTLYEAPGSYRGTNAAYVNPFALVGNGVTSNIFTSGEIYIPNYTGNGYKSMTAEGAGEQNSSSTIIRMAGGLWRNTSAITSIKFGTDSGSNFAVGSEITLYGIKNS